jgi:FAD-linked sulfhydryl oxidase
MPRRNNLTLILLAVSAFLTISFILAFRNEASESTYDQAPIAVTDSILHGEATAHKIENATLK